MRGWLVLGMLGWGLAMNGLGSPATESRTWSATAGSSLEAVVTDVEGGKVLMVRKDGSKLQVPMESLVAADQEFLTQHFKLNERSPSGLAPLTGLAVEMGKVIDSVQTPTGSKYRLYVPKSLKAGRPAPVLMFTHAGGGKPPGPMESMLEGAELCGWIVAVSLDSRNGTGGDFNLNHVMACLDHMKATLPVDASRLYFTGNSGGGISACGNAAKIPGALGVIPIIAYYSEDFGFSKEVDYYWLNGATDYNRTAAAFGRKTMGKKGFHRFFAGGHTSPPNSMMTDAMLWLNARFLAGAGAPQAGAKLDFEGSLIKWLNGLKASEPARALYWASALQTDYKVEPVHRAHVDALVTELGRNPANKLFGEFLADADNFSQDVFAPFGPGSRSEHATDAITRAANKIAAKYAAHPDLQQIATALGEPSQKIKK